jgi:hypothetical protein
VSDKSPRHTASQKSDKTIKEKRALKKAKKTDVDPTFQTMTTRRGGA